MKITILCVGKIKEKYWTDAISEYTKRISRFSEINIVEVSEEYCGDSPSDATINLVKNAEGRRLLSKISDTEYVIVLDLKGKQLNSEEFARKIQDIKLMGRSHIAFVIGGSYGISDECLKRGDFHLCMSEMTFPHQMARVIVLEQIFRAMKISAGEKYHK